MTLSKVVSQHLSSVYLALLDLSSVYLVGIPYSTRSSVYLGIPYSTIKIFQMLLTCSYSLRKTDN